MPIDRLTLEVVVATSPDVATVYSSIFGMTYVECAACALDFLLSDANRSFVLNNTEFYTLADPPNCRICGVATRTRG